MRYIEKISLDGIVHGKFRWYSVHIYIWLDGFEYKERFILERWVWYMFTQRFWTRWNEIH